MSYLSLSIDLDAELAKITQKQYLNNVHYLINMVRHALARKPSRIDITYSATYIHLAQDGEALDAEELRLIQTLLSPTAGYQESQKALEMLEAQFGVTLLSLLRTAPEATLTSGTTHITFKAGQWVEHPSEPIRGYRITAAVGNRIEDMATFVFACSGASIPLYLNGEAINKPIELTDQLCQLVVSSPHGAGKMGIPLQGDLCVFTYYKVGIKVGQRQYKPVNGVVYHGFYNNESPDYEGNFEETIHQANGLFKANVAGLYREGLFLFHELNHEQRSRFKSLVLRQDDTWQFLYQHLPLFHSKSGDWQLSIEQLTHLKKQFAGIPEGSRDNKLLPGYTPVLSFEDKMYLEGLGILTKPAQPLSPKRAVPPCQRSFLPLAEASLCPKTRKLLQDLSSIARIFVMVEGEGGYECDPQTGITYVYVPNQHPLVQEAIATYGEHRYDVALLRYRLIGLVKPT